MKRRNRISGQFAARRIEMLESPAYRILSRVGHMVISRVEIELAAHGGNDNGRLPITYEDFVEYGMHRSVRPAIRERRRGCNTERRSPNRFYLTYPYNHDNEKRPPTVERGKQSLRKRELRSIQGLDAAREHQTWIERAESV